MNFYRRVGIEIFKDFAENRLKLVCIFSDLGMNAISWIDSSAWSLCSTLQWLSLSTNRLRTLPSFLFKKLSHLEYLSLADNQIDTFHKNTMRGLDSLRFL